MKFVGTMGFGVHWHSKVVIRRRMEGTIKEGGLRVAQHEARLLSRAVQQARGHPAGGNSLSPQTCSMDQFFPSQKLKD